MNSFAVFILTYGRSDQVITYRMLRRQGYTGRIVLIVDDSDDSLPNYMEFIKQSEQCEIFVFNKEELKGTFDIGDNFDGMNVVVFARNVCHKVAEEIGIDNFLVLDDDYPQMIFKFNERMEWKTGNMLANDLDCVFDAFVSFMETTPTLTVTMAQGGDFIGGVGHGRSFGSLITLRRKAMNSFFCRTDRPFQFTGRINEDVNTYAVLGNIGHLFFTHNFITLNQTQTQQAEGGLTDFYLDQGTYVKSFYTVMMHPSGSCVRMMYANNPRIHHMISWNNTAPKIIRETVKRI